MRSPVKRKHLVAVVVVAVPAAAIVGTAVVVEGSDLLKLHAYLAFLERVGADNFEAAAKAAAAYPGNDTIVDRTIAWAGALRRT